MGSLKSNALLDIFARSVLLTCSYGQASRDADDENIDYQIKSVE